MARPRRHGAGRTARRSWQFKYEKTGAKRNDRIVSSHPLARSTASTGHRRRPERLYRQSTSHARTNNRCDHPARPEANCYGDTRTRPPHAGTVGHTHAHHCYACHNSDADTHDDARCYACHNSDANDHADTQCYAYPNPHACPDCCTYADPHPYANGDHNPDGPRGFRNLCKSDPV